MHTATSPTILNAAAVGVDMHAVAFLRVARILRLARNLPGVAKFEQAALQPWSIPLAILAGTPPIRSIRKNYSSDLYLMEIKRLSEQELHKRREILTPS